MRLLELTDLVRRRDPAGHRLPVEVEAVVERLRASGQHRAARIARRLPARGGVLDDEAIDRLLVRVHCELQRLAEELQQGRRVAEQLAGWVDELRRADPGRSVRVVDVGCGIGYTLRWLAAHRALGKGVELVGVDLDRTLVSAAAERAAREGLDVRFLVGDAFDPGRAVTDPGHTIVISSGLLHHLPAEDLPAFFGRHGELGVFAFCHWDPVPGAWSTAGAWVFHRARMREPVSRHDGVLSVRRAHRAATLLAAARPALPGYEVSCVEGWPPALTQVLRPVIGVRR
ncbi:hypothetical protein GCM10023321_54210 [Pseudonocardia eucalypti]|uniref:Methyltransferase domain-containing protein n=1 Tax=Pseudonocardia eucalypti TaxID=648755 RepID=A0ABP9QNV5_9PSEU|nr:SAM-dependent methyltransferase [Pseudonocardia eucalypti]